MVRRLTTSPAPSAVLERLRSIVAALPDVTETLTWGHPNWRVGGAQGKLFLGWGVEHGVGILGFKADPRERDVLLERQGFSVAPYVGKHGWLSLDLSSHPPSWQEIRRLIERSHALVLATLPASRRGAGGAAAPPGRVVRRRSARER